MQQLLAYALSNAQQYFSRHHSDFYDLLIAGSIAFILAVIHEGIKRQYKHKDQPFDESNIYK